MTTKIQEALKQLDPANDDHWTADGLPRMDAVEKLVGSSDITREDVTNAAPDFTRDTARDLEVVEPSEEEVTDVEAHPENQEEAEATGEVKVGEAVDEPREEVITIAEEPSEEEAAPEITAGDPTADWHPDPPEHEDEVDPEPEEPTSPPTEAELLQAQLDGLTELMLEAQRAQDRAKTEATRLANEVNEINRKMDRLTKADPNHATAGIRAYLKSQNDLRAGRAKRLRNFTEAVDVHPQDLMRSLDPRAPIDRAMHGRKPPRGSRRPVHPLVAHAHAKVD